MAASLPWSLDKGVFSFLNKRCTYLEHYYNALTSFTCEPVGSLIYTIFFRVASIFAILCHAIIRLTLIGLKHPLVTGQSQAREAMHAILAGSEPITGQESQTSCPSMQLTNHTPGKPDKLSQHA